MASSDGIMLTAENTIVNKKIRERKFNFEGE